MREPVASRPDMPGYGIAPAPDGAGLLPWSWAVDRLVASREFWVATVGPDASPHVMPVWGIWHQEAMWFSSGLRSRRARDLAANPRCTVTSEETRRPVVINGMAERILESTAIASFVRLVNAKYGVDYGIDFYDPAVNGIFAVRPVKVIALDEDRFVESPTRWSFAD